MNISDTLNEVRRTAGEGEDFLIDGISKIVPWLAPIPSAALVSKATVHHLNWAPWLAIIVAAVIEGMGIVTVITALSLWNYNKSRRKTDEQAPFTLALALVVIYIMATVSLTIVLDIVPELARFAPALFPVVAIVGAVSNALRFSHNRLLRAIANDKVERKMLRQTNRQPDVYYSAALVSREVSNIEESNTSNAKLLEGRKAKVDSRIDKFIDIIRTNPGLSIADIARQMGLARQTVYSYIHQLEKAGKIRVTDYGIELID